MLLSFIDYLSINTKASNYVPVCTLLDVILQVASDWACNMLTI